MQNHEEAKVKQERLREMGHGKQKPESKRNTILMNNLIKKHTCLSLWFHTPSLT
jgi:hypothetical protein